MSETPPSFPARVAEYDTWYQTPRGRWIGRTEYALLRSMLKPEQAAPLIDVGCGTGYFTRLLAHEVRGEVVGIDPDEDAFQWLTGGDQGLTERVKPRY